MYALSLSLTLTYTHICTVVHTCALSLSLSHTHTHTHTHTHAHTPSLTLTHPFRAASQSGKPAGWRAKDLSVDHKPEHEGERKRILMCKGRVERTRWAEKFHIFFQRALFVQTWR